MCKSDLFIVAGTVKCNQFTKMI